MSKPVFVVRFKRNNNMVEEAHCAAETLEHARKAAELWCQGQATALSPVRLINVRPLAEFDAEELLTPKPVAPPPKEPEPTASAPPTSFGQKLKQSLGA